MINYQIFLLKNFPFLIVKFSIYFNRRVFVIARDPNRLQADIEDFDHPVHRLIKFSGRKPNLVGNAVPQKICFRSSFGLFHYAYISGNRYTVFYGLKEKCISLHFL